MWKKGILEIKNNDGTSTQCHYWVKSFEEAHEEYGIDGGRISKLMIKVNKKITLNYDRGWDILPQDKTTKKAYKKLLKQFN